MGSTRLPGKALLRINGKCLMERAVERLSAARSLNGLAVLTTTLKEDDVLEEEAIRLGVPIHRGLAQDVLGRFRQASDRFQPDIIVRATADNPLIDIGSVDRVVQAVDSGDLDYCMVSDLPVGAATEAFTRATLQKIDVLAQTARQREHVTLYIKEHPEDFRAAFLDPPKELRRPDLRITVDTLEDFLFLESLLRALPQSEHPIPLSHYLDLPLSFSGARV